MAEQIVIFSSRYDEVDDLRPYLELLARPGTTVLVLYSVETNLFPWWSEGIVSPRAAQCGTSINVLSAAVLRQRQAQTAQAQIAGLRSLLESQGITLRLDYYTGRWRRELARLTKQSTQTVMVLRSSFSTKVARWLGRSYLRRRPAAERLASMRLSLVHH